MIAGGSTSLLLGSMAMSCGHTALSGGIAMGLVLGVLFRIFAIISPKFFPAYSDNLSRFSHA